MEEKEYDFLDLLTIMSFIISIQSLELAQKNLIENREQTENTKRILVDLENHLESQDEHLASQDRVLENITR